MNMYLKSLVGLVLCGALSPALAVTVGTEANCDFNTINDALGSVPRGGSVSIRLSNNAPHDSFLSVDRNLTIIGGYTNCSDSTADANAPSEIQGIGNNQPNAHLSGFSNPIDVNVILVNLRIQQGSSSRGGGIRVTAANSVRLSNVDVLSNTATEFGGGIYLDGSKGASLVIEHDSNVAGNIAEQRGGGVYCVDANAANESFLDFRSGVVSGNVAAAHGGGFYLDGCDLNGSASGTRRVTENEVDKVPYTDVLLDEFGSVSGAGIYATGGSHIQLGSRQSLTSIDTNVGRHNIYNGFGFHYEVDRGEGGGVALVGNSLAEFVNTHIADNQAAEGGGVIIRPGARLEMRKAPNGCVDHPDYSGCASLTGNRARGFDSGFTGCVSSDQNWAGRGGAIALRGGSAELDGVWVKGNQVNQTDGCTFSNHIRYPHGAAFDVRGGSIDILNTVVHGNGHSSADDVIHVSGTGVLFRAFHSTIFGNSSVDDALMRTSNGAPAIGLFNSIVVESAKLYENDGSANGLLRAVCVYASSLSSLDDAPESDLRENVAGGNPGFVSGGNDDFRLRDDAAALDLCRADELTTRDRLDESGTDIDGSNRPNIVNGNGARTWDAGAYENQSGQAGVAADLSMEIDDGGFVIGFNQTMGYRVTLANNGPNAVTNPGFTFAVGTSAQLPIAIIPFGAGWTCGQSGHTASCQYANALAPGENAPEVAFQFTSPDEPTVLLASVTTVLPSNIVDTLNTNNTASLTTSIGVNSDVIPVFGQVPPSLVTGQSAQLGVILRNNGPDVSLAPRLRVTFPDLLSDVSVLDSPSSWNCGPLFPDGSGRVSMVCATAQAAVSDFEFTLQIQVPSSAPAPSDWLIELNAEQALPDAGPNNRSISLPVVQGTVVDELFSNSFED